MIIFESRFIKVEFDEADQLYYLIWSKATNEMTNEEFKENLIKFADIAKEYKLNRHIADLREFCFIVSPELQEWFDSTVGTSLVNIGYKKIGVLMSPDIFSQVSVEQLMNEEVTANIENQYFENIEDAKKWVLK